MKKKEELKGVASVETSRKIKADSADGTDVLTAPVKKEKKKGPLIQIPVLISLLIVVLAAVGYYVYSAYYLNLAEGIVWKAEKNGIDYYFEFLEDHLIKITLASNEETFSYTEVPEDGENVIEIFTPDGTIKLQYYMSGSRKLKNQKLTITDFYTGEDLYDCDEVESITPALEKPAQVQLDPKLTGVWERRFNDNYYIRLYFNKDGTLREETTYQYGEGTFIGVTNQNYTTANGYVHTTTAVIDDDPQTGKLKIKYEMDQEPYQFDGDQLMFREQKYTRLKETATPDEASK